MFPIQLNAFLPVPMEAHVYGQGPVSVPLGGMDFAVKMPGGRCRP